MPKRFIERYAGYGSLDAVPFHAKLAAKCGGCGVIKELRRDSIVRAAGRHCWLDSAAKMLRCLECGHKGGAILEGIFVEDGRDDAPHT